MTTATPRRRSLRRPRRSLAARWWPRSFQEYLAGCAVATDTGSEAAIAEGLWTDGTLGDPSWEGALRFAVGAFGSSARVRGFVDALLALAEREQGDRREGRIREFCVLPGAGR